MGIFYPCCRLSVRPSFESRRTQSIVLQATSETERYALPGKTDRVSTRVLDSLKRCRVRLMCSTMVSILYTIVRSLRFQYRSTNQIDLFLLIYTIVCTANFWYPKHLCTVLYILDTQIHNLSHCKILDNSHPIRGSTPT